jgi:histone-lysine N-methyltransferase SETMAR
MEWNNHSSLRKKKKKKLQTSAGKVMVSFFWDSERITFVEFLERRATTNSERDLQTLKKLKQRTGMVRPNRKIDHVLLLLRDNTRLHTSPRTREAITTIGWTVLPHPPYSPDLAPSDYHRFGPVKNGCTWRTTICGQRRSETQYAWRAPTLQLNFTSAYSV